MFLIRMLFSCVTELFSVAFHAVVSENKPTITRGEKVKFDISKLNTGNG